MIAGYIFLIVYSKKRRTIGAFWSKLKQNFEEVAPKVAPIVAAQVGASDYSELQDGRKPIPQVPEIQGVLHSENFACNNTQKENSIKKWAVQNSNL